MKKQITSYILVLMSSLAFVGCASAPIPQAKLYSVEVGGKTYQAKSIKVHGDWLEIQQQDNETIWVNSGTVIQPLVK
jgi:hypothetical protein